MNGPGGLPVNPSSGMGAHDLDSGVDWPVGIGYQYFGHFFGQGAIVYQVANSLFIDSTNRHHLYRGGIGTGSAGFDSLC